MTIVNLAMNLCVAHPVTHFASSVTTKQFRDEKSVCIQPYIQIYFPKTPLKKKLPELMKKNFIIS